MVHCLEQEAENVYKLLATKHIWQEYAGEYRMLQRTQVITSPPWVIECKYYS